MALQSDKSTAEFRADQLQLLLKIVVGVLILLSLFGAGNQLVEFSLRPIDIVIYLAIIIIAILLYFGVKQLVQQQLQDPELEREFKIQIREYGVILSDQFAVNSIDAEDIYLEYNKIEDIFITRDKLPEITIITADNKFVIDFEYFTYPGDNLDNRINQLDTLYRIFIKMKENLDKVENKDHPTIIPKAYFRDIISEE